MKNADVKIGERYFDKAGTAYDIVGREKLRSETTVKWIRDEEGGKWLFRCSNGDVVSAQKLFGDKKTLDRQLVVTSKASSEYMRKIKVAGLDSEGCVKDPGKFVAAFVAYLTASEGTVKLGDHGWLK